MKSDIKLKLSLILEVTKKLLMGIPSIGITKVLSIVSKKKVKKIKT